MPEIQIICDVVCTTIDVILYEHKGNVTDTGLLT